MTAKIYLDFNSTHPPDAVALAAGREFYLAHFANSSGLSLASQQVNERIERAREDIARLLLVTAEQVIFTSCATESNNLLVREFHSRHKAGIFPRADFAIRTPEHCRNIEATGEHRDPCI
ncbi:MAG: aminotransferase class V-fold PLP-dependent enzyme [Turneriella sp.]